MSGLDYLTILCAKGLPATKTIGLGPDGKPAIVSSYGSGKRYSVCQEPVSDLAGFAAALERVDHNEFIVRGEPLPGTDWRRCVRRLHADPVTGERPTFRERPRRWLLLDFDTVAAPAGLDPMAPVAAATYLRSLLPAAFHRASFWWAYTASAGIKPELRMRLGFWLDRPASKGMLDRWLRDAPVDASIFRPVQPIYVARPILKGVPDPVPVRSGLVWDREDEVRVPELPAEAPKPIAITHSPAGRRYVSGDSASVAERRLEPLCETVARAAKGGRHRCLLWAAARAVELDDAIPRAEIAARLLDAARRAGLDEPDRELGRQIRNGFKLGVFGGGSSFELPGSRGPSAAHGAEVAARLLQSHGVGAAA